MDKHHPQPSTQLQYLYYVSIFPIISSISVLLRDLVSMHIDLLYISPCNTHIGNWLYNRMLWLYSNSSAQMACITLWRGMQNAVATPMFFSRVIITMLIGKVYFHLNLDTEIWKYNENELNFALISIPLGFQLYFLHSDHSWTNY